jgi:tRNA A37 threonylcarbamoyladenosine synthetase subunit TsaC/SUA5/YrdC
MKIIETSIEEFDDDVINEAINVLANGGIVLYPTDNNTTPTRPPAMAKII